jgi:hypothetical protein
MQDLQRQLQIPARPTSFPKSEVPGPIENKSEFG